MQHVSTQKRRGGTNLAKWQTWTSCLFVEMKDNVTSPSHFIIVIVKKNIYAFVITTLQMTEAPCLLVNKIEIIIYVHHLHLTPSYFLSIPCIWPKCPSGFSTKKNSKKASLLNLIETNGTFWISNLSQSKYYKLKVEWRAQNMT